MSAHADDKIKVGISVGDINGVGVEIIIKTLADNRILQDFTPVVYGSGKIASYYKKTLGFNEFNFFIINNVDEALPKKANLVNLSNEEIQVNMGQPTETGGKFAFQSLEAAVKDLAAGKVDVLVTAPVNKLVMQSDKFRFPGHTEYLASVANVDEALMFMIADSMRVGIVTGHIPLAQVAQQITKEKILKKLRAMQQSLVRDFGIRKPKIAVLGLNPHAGENGMLGKEEKDIIEPAITAAKSENILAVGPYPADGFFGSGNFRNFDAVLAMYHDQGLSPFKALTFDSGVNYTAGLPIVRTSPDHGTGYDICGKGVASETSFRNALFLAKDIYLQRKLYKELNANPLQQQVKAERNDRE